jgi:hypothetical protein
VRLGPFTKRDPIGLAGGVNQYGYVGGDPINSSDPFGLFKVDLSNLDADQRRAIAELRRSSQTFDQWYQALDRIPADQLTVMVGTASGNWVEHVQGLGDGWTVKLGKTTNVLFSSTSNWATSAEFETVALHEFAHAAAGVPGGTPAGCYDPNGTPATESCAVDEQNKGHEDLKIRARKDHQDTGPFKPSKP